MCQVNKEIRFKFNSRKDVGCILLPCMDGEFLPFFQSLACDFFYKPAVNIICTADTCTVTVVKVIHISIIRAPENSGIDIL